MRNALCGTWMGLAGYALFLPPLAFAIHRGWTDAGYMAVAGIFAVMLAATGAFHLAIRTGWSRRFRDPSLTMAQIAVSAAVILAAGRLAGEARGAMLMLSFTGFCFGIYVLSTRQMLALTGAILVGYCALMVVPEWWSGGVGSDRFAREVLRGFTLGTALVWISILGGLVGRLRKRLLHALAQVRTMATHDELTGVYNRRELMQVLAREVERVQRHGEPLSVCILDLDHFKRVNDRYGHACGDAVLRGFADRLQRELRGCDVIGRAEEPCDTLGVFGRIGGEEFMVLLPHTTLDGARACLDRLREHVQREPFESPRGPLRVTFSAGAASYIAGGDSLEDMVRRADAALYRAKRLGRDRCELDVAA